MRRVSRFCAGSQGSRACAVSDAVLFRCSLLVLVYVMFFRLRALGRRSSGSVAPFVCAVVVVVVVGLVGLLVVWFVKSIPSLGIEPKTTRLKV